MTPSINEKVSLIFYKQGMRKARQGYFKRALKYYSQAILFDRQNTDFYVEKAAVYEWLGKYDMALDSLNTALSINPENHNVLINRPLYFRHRRLPNRIMTQQ